MCAFIYIIYDKYIYLYIYIYTYLLFQIIKAVLPPCQYCHAWPNTRNLICYNLQL